MGWLFTAIVEIFIEQVGEIIKWFLMVFDGVSIDIGYDTGSSQNSLFVADYFSGKETQGLFDRIFPQASGFFGVFLTLAYALVIVILVTEVYKAMVTTDTRNTESPISLVGKSLVSIFFVTFSYDIFIWFEKCANQFYLLFYEKAVGITDSYTEEAGDNVFNALSYLSDTDHVFRNSVTFDYESGMMGHAYLGTLSDGDDSKLALMLIVCVLFTTLAWRFAILVIEIYERYVVLGVLFYTCPLAFATLSSKKSSEIFSKWIAMVLSQFLLLMLNLFFVSVFVGALQTLFGNLAENHYLFENGADMAKKMFLLIGWLITGSKADEHLCNLGLSAARTGSGLASAILVGAGMTGAMLSMPGKAIRAGKNIVSTGKGIGSAASGIRSSFTKGERMREAAEGNLAAGISNGKVTQEGAKNAWNAKNTNQKYTGAHAKEAMEAAGIKAGETIMKQADWNQSDFGAGKATIRNENGEVIAEFAKTKDFRADADCAVKSMETKVGNVSKKVGATEMKADNENLIRALNRRKDNSISWVAGTPMRDSFGGYMRDESGEIMMDTSKHVVTGFPSKKDSGREVITSEKTAEGRTLPDRKAEPTHQAANNYAADMDLSRGEVVATGATIGPAGDSVGYSVQKLSETQQTGFSSIKKPAESPLFEQRQSSEIGRDSFSKAEVSNSTYSRFFRGPSEAGPAMQRPAREGYAERRPGDSKKPQSRNPSPANMSAGTEKTIIKKVKVKKSAHALRKTILKKEKK